MPVLVSLLSLSLFLFRSFAVPAQVAVCWFVSNRAEGPIFALINTPIMKQVILVLSEVFRANSMCGIVVLSNSILKVREEGIRSAVCFERSRKKALGTKALYSSSTKNVTVVTSMDLVRVRKT